MLTKGELIVKLQNQEVELPKNWGLSWGDTILALRFTQDKRIHKLLSDYMERKGKVKQ